MVRPVYQRARLDTGAWVPFAGAAPPPPAASSTFWGVSASDFDSVRDDWPAYRTYDTGDALNLGAGQGVNGLPNTITKPSLLAVSDSTGKNLGDTNPVYATCFSQAMAELNAFYYTGGSTSQVHSARWDCIYVRSNGNENFDKGALELPHTTDGIAKFVESQRALYNACHYIDPATGVRRFPLAHATWNPTHDAQRQGRVLDAAIPAAPYVDGLMWSDYSPGRQTTVDNPTFNWPSRLAADQGKQPQGYMVRIFEATKAVQTAAGRPLWIGIGETGIGQDPGNKNSRPYFAVHGLASNLLWLSESYGIDLLFALWWNSQKQLQSGGDDPAAPPNKLADEPGDTNPSTADVWFNPTAYDHTRGATHPAAWAGLPAAIAKKTGTAY